MSRYLLACIDCDHQITLWRPEPRVPLCTACKHHRDQAPTRRARKGRRHHNYRRPTTSGSTRITNINVP